MTLWDAHLHSHFSGDATVAPEKIYMEAKEKNLPGITYTDHLDLDYMEDPELFLLDLKTYTKEIKALSEKYTTDYFGIACGIELGLQPHLPEIYKELLTPYDLDYIIGSTHVIHGMDPYYPKYFSTRDERTAFLEYYEMILENITAFCDIDSIGHLDYCFRYGPYPEAAKDTYTPYREIVDEILKQIIRKDFALEINTGAFRCNMTEPNPCLSILKRYHQLGGNYITLGSDAHKLEHIALQFDALPALLHECGFREYYVFKKRKPYPFPLSS